MPVFTSIGLAVGATAATAAATGAAVVGTTAAVAGAGYSAYSSHQQGKAQQALSNYNASVTTSAADYNANAILAASELNAGRIEQDAAYNALLAKQEAGNTVRDGLAQALGVRTQGRALQGTQRARRAASGVVVGTGSSLAVDVAQAGIIEQHALNIERSAQNRANLLEHAGLVELVGATDTAAIERWQGRTEATNTRWGGNAQASLDRLQGTAARRAGQRNAAATILQGAGSAAGIVGEYKYRAIG